MTFVAKKFRSQSSSAGAMPRVIALTVLLAACLIQSFSTQAATADWLAIDLNTNDRADSLLQSRKDSGKAFDDDVSQTVSVIQNVRAIMTRGAAIDAGRLADAFLSSSEINARDWLSKIPRARHLVTAEPDGESLQKVSCYLNNKSSRIVCNDAKKSSVLAASLYQASPTIVYNKDLIAQVSREGHLPPPAKSDANQPSSQPAAPDESVVTLKPTSNGLITALGGEIIFTDENQSKKIVLDESLKNLEVSVFVRDPSTLFWDETSWTLVAKKSGETEVFVVSPGRISIIEARIKSTTVAAAAAIADNASQNIQQLSQPQSQGAKKIEIPSSLASLDGLDYAATRGPISANHSGLSASAPDLAVADELAKVGDAGLNSGAQFVRAKAKTSFDTIKLKIVDDRSQPGTTNYPISGVRVKIAGTEFNELTNARGEVEVRDVPVGSRLLIDISDERGYIMPQVSEIHADRDGVSRAIPQMIVARRFASLDLTARSGGVIQDMQKSSLCGIVARNQAPISGVTVSLDASAVGPFYFNHLGLVDLRLGGTGHGGRFCFFNVEPGPAAIGFKMNNGQDSLAAVVGAIAGRHIEEIFDIGESRHASSTLTTIASANEQLGSDLARANRRDLVEAADVYAVGSGELMVPVEHGIMTTASPVMPFKGRVWTVSASSDFETSVQAIPFAAPTHQQLLTLIPNGFVNDMSYFAQTIHQNDSGSVVIEHGNLSGQGNQSVKMRLVDAYGQDVGDGWYFSDEPVSKAIFFNVPPGLYAILIETQTGHWIAADTVIVYSDSVSIVKTGSPMERRAQSTAQAEIQ